MSRFFSRLGLGWALVLGGGLVGQLGLVRAAFPAPVASMSELRQLSPSLSASVELLGYYQPGDGGQGFFAWDSASLAPDDNGTCIRPAGLAPAQPGRFLRQVADSVNLRWFGARGDGQADDTAAAQAAVNYAARQGVGLYWPAGRYRVNQLAAPAGPLHWSGPGSGLVTVAPASGIQNNLICPVGDLTVQGMGFAGYFQLFEGGSIAEGSRWRAEDCRWTGGTHNRSDSSENGGFFATHSETGPALGEMTVSNCLFQHGRHGIYWLKPFNNVVITRCRFESMQLGGVWVGGNRGDLTRYRRVAVTDCGFKDIFPVDFRSGEVHAALAMGVQIIFSRNQIENVRDHIERDAQRDSEALYLKAIYFDVSHNQIINGGRGDAMIVVKGAPWTDDDRLPTARANGFAMKGEIAHNTVIFTEALAADTRREVNGIMSYAPDTLVHHNLLRGAFDRAIETYNTAVVSDNVIRGGAGDSWCGRGILMVAGAVQPGGQPITLAADRNSMQGVARGIEFRVEAGATCQMAAARDNQISPAQPSPGSPYTLIGATAVRGRLPARPAVFEQLLVTGNQLQGVPGARAGSAVQLITTETFRDPDRKINGRFGGVLLSGNQIADCGEAFEFAVAAGDVREALIADTLVTRAANGRNWNHVGSLRLAGYRNPERPASTQGRGVVPAGASSVKIRHGLAADLEPAKAKINLTPLGPGVDGAWWVEEITQREFTVVLAAPAPSGGFAFQWEARVPYLE